MRVRLHESLRALFYTPYYVAIELGCNREEGLEVELGRPSGPDRAALDLFDGHADVTWGGPMRMLQTMDREPEQRLVAFGEAVTRDPFFLVGAQPIPDFRLDDLIGLKVGIVTEVPTPWLCLQEDLRRAGIDPQAIDRGPARSMAENVEALREGQVDVIQVFEPFAETLTAVEEGHVLRAAAARGPTSYTTYYAPAEYVQENRNVCVALSRALFKAQTWLHGATGEEIKDLVRPYFPDIDADILTGAIQRYLALGVWGDNPRLPLAGFLRLKMALISGGFIGRDVPFEACVDTSIPIDAMKPET